MNVALAGTTPQFMMEMPLYSTNFADWAEGVPRQSVLTMKSDDDEPPDMFIATPQETPELVSPTGTPMLRVVGWRSGHVVLSAHQDVSYATVSTVAAMGPSNRHARLGLLAHYHNPENHLGLMVWPGNRITLNSRGEDSKSVNGHLHKANGDRDGTVNQFDFWTITMKTEPGPENTLIVKVQLKDHNGVVREISEGGDFVNGWWVVEDMPVPSGGLRGTVGVQTAVTEGGNSEDKGIWFDSIAVQRLEYAGSSE
jgi:hypothetical protein